MVAQRFLMRAGGGGLAPSVEIAQDQQAIMEVTLA